MRSCRTDSLPCPTRRQSCRRAREAIRPTSCHWECRYFIQRRIIARISSTVNLDQKVNQKNSLSGRFFYSRATINLPFSPNGANVPGWGTDALNRNTMFVLSDTHAFDSSLVNVARFGYIRFDGLASVENPISAQQVGVGTPTGATGSELNMPQMTRRHISHRRWRHSERVVCDKLVHLAGHGCAHKGPAQRALWSRIQAA